MIRQPSQAKDIASMLDSGRVLHNMIQSEVAA
jgi:hypothetical protein